MTTEEVELAAEVASSTWEAGPPPRASVVVSTFGRRQFLPELFACLEAQTEPAACFEVVVVDDASSDGTWPILTDLVARTTMRSRAVRLATNVGQGGGRNVALGRCRGEIVAMTDDDCLPTPGWLAALCGPFGSEKGAAKAFVVQGRTEAWTADGAGAGTWARTVWVLRPTWLFETCNIAYRRSDLLAVGGFPRRGDAPVGPHGRIVGEDAIAGWRVVENGSDLVFEPEALVHHRHHPASYIQWLAEQRGRGSFPALVARSPIGRRALWRGYFLAPRTAAFDAALVGLAAGVCMRRPRWLVLALPWIGLALEEARSRGGRPVPIRLLQLAGGDLVGAASLAVESIRSRSPVL